MKATKSVDSPRIAVTAACLAALILATQAFAQSKPNILVIFGDDVGQTNISAYSFGVVGYKTPNGIDQKIDASFEKRGIE